MMKKYIFFITILLLIGGGITLGINRSKQSVGTTKEKFTVVTTLFPLYDFVKNIGGDFVDVTLLLPPGVEAHSFEPKPSDIVRIDASDLFVYTGKFMEPWAEDIIKGVTNKNMQSVDASIGIDLMKLTPGMPDEANGLDPHIWLDFDNDKKMIHTLTSALIAKDPLHTAYYHNREEDYM
ncbi:MAG: zinc ABC transporter substrate-binding protein, partial [Candidatus Moranbacteria bacterium]|nr:zinc ABC transporter substrate-binding protein [Candidatus Moranbacteria bacterium]